MLGKRYMQYTMTTKASGAKVNRRFSDFLWLEKALEAKFPGHLIPSPGEQRMTQTSTDEFQEQRIRGLSKMMTRIATHEKFKEYKVVQHFLNSKNLDKNIAGSESTGIKALKALSGFGSAVVGAFSSDPSVRAETKDDKSCSEIEAYAKEMKLALDKLQGFSSDLFNKESELASTWRYFDRTCVDVEKCESKYVDHLGGLVKAVGLCGDDFADILYKTQVHERKLVTQNLKDYAYMCDAILAMMERRKKAVQNLEIKMKDQMKKRDNLGKLIAKNANAQKITDAKNAEAEALKAVENGKDRLANMTKTIFAEVLKFRHEKKKAMKDMYVTFIKMRVEKAKKETARFEKLLAEADSFE